jgi:hypothetical protein
MSTTASRKRTAEFSVSPGDASEDCPSERPSKVLKNDEENAAPAADKPEANTTASDKAPTSFSSFSSSAAPAATGGGFGAYASTNPFAVQAKSQPLIASSDGFAVRIKSKPNLSVNASQLHGSGSASSSASTSPRLSGVSPRMNPFSSTSPAHNPFMSFVEKQDDLWKSFSNQENKEGAGSGSDKTAKEEVPEEVKPAPKPAVVSSFGAWGTGTIGAGFGVGAQAALPLPVAKPLFGASATADMSCSLHSNIPLSRQLSNNSNRSGNNSEEEGGDGDGDAGDADAAGDEEVPVTDDDSTTRYNILTQESTANGEEAEDCVMLVRAKMFRMGLPKEAVVAENKFDYQGSSSSSKDDQSPPAKAPPPPTGEWIEVGTGPLKILMYQARGSSDRSSDWARIVMRREATAGGGGTKVILNVLLRAETVTVAKLGDKAMRISCIQIAEEEEPAAASITAGKEDKATSVLAQAAAAEAEESKSKAKPVTYLLKVKNSVVS